MFDSEVSSRHAHECAKYWNKFFLWLQVSNIQRRLDLEVSAKLAGCDKAARASSAAAAALREDLAQRAAQHDRFAARLAALEAAQLEAARFEAARFEAARFDDDSAHGAAGRHSMASSASADGHGGMAAELGRCMCIDMCTDMCIDMGIDMCFDICIDICDDQVGRLVNGTGRTRSSSGRVC